MCLLIPPLPNEIASCILDNIHIATLLRLRTVCRLWARSMYAHCVRSEYFIHADTVPDYIIPRLNRIRELCITNVTNFAELTGHAIFPNLRTLNLFPRNHANSICDDGLSDLCKRGPRMPRLSSIMCTRPVYMPSGAILQRTMPALQNMYMNYIIFTHEEFNYTTITHFAADKMQCSKETRLLLPAARTVILPATAKFTSVVLNPATLTDVRLQMLTKEVKLFLATCTNLNQLCLTCGILRHRNGNPQFAPVRTVPIHPETAISKVCLETPDFLYASARCLTNLIIALESSISLALDLGRFPCLVMARLSACLSISVSACAHHLSLRSLSLCGSLDECNHLDRLPLRELHLRVRQSRSVITNMPPHPTVELIILEDVIGSIPPHIFWDKFPKLKRKDVYYI